MEPATPRDLCNALARSNLHPPDEVRALLKRFEEEQATSREEVVSFARWLTARGKLSDFQSALLLKGRWERLKVDDYVLVDRIGQGRLAGVYEARHRLGQRVAVKILPPSKVGDPQVFGRFIGFATYQHDSNLRNSTMVGIVGAGGIGGTLFSAFQRYDYDFVAAILLSIIGMIMVGEVLATWVRGVFLEKGKVDEE